MLKKMVGIGNKCDKVRFRVWSNGETMGLMSILHGVTGRRWNRDGSVW